MRYYRRESARRRRLVIGFLVGLLMGVAFGYQQFKTGGKLYARFESLFQKKAA